MEHAQEFIFPVLAGLATALMVCGFGALATVRIRAFRFRQAKALPADSSGLPAIPFPQRDAARSNAADALRELVQTEHMQARLLQDRCVAWLVSASVTLFAAFAASAAAATLMASAERFHVYSAALDVAALLLVGGAFFQSGRFRAQWIRQRAKTEFLRQWAQVEFALLADVQRMTQEYDTFVARVDAALAPERGDLLEAVIAFADCRVEEIRLRFNTVQQVQPDALASYLQRRPIRQVKWFSTSVDRISMQHGRRGTYMLILILLAALAALVKFVALVVVTDGTVAANVAMFALLLFIGLAAASTSAYLGQNLRSVRHRYRAQLRAIDDWFAAHKDIVALAQARREVSARDVPALAEAVVGFERLMNAELIDWIAISTHDAMELAPA